MVLAVNQLSPEHQVRDREVMLGCVVSISESSSLTFFSPLQRHEMIFSRMRGIRGAHTI